MIYLQRSNRDRTRDVHARVGLVEVDAAPRVEHAALNILGAERWKVSLGRIARQRHVAASLLGGRRLQVGSSRRNSVTRR